MANSAKLKNVLNNNEEKSTLLKMLEHWYLYLLYFHKSNSSTTQNRDITTFRPQCFWTKCCNHNRTFWRWETVPL